MQFVIIALVVSLLANALALLVGVKVVAKRGGLSYIKFLTFKTLNRKSFPTPAYESRIIEFSRYSHTKDDVVFLGDSITNMGKWFEFFPQVACRNRGIGGETSKDVLNRIDSIIDGHPKKIFILLGVNDLLSKVSPQEFLSNYKALLQKIKLESPVTRIYVQSILPINETMCKSSLSTSVIEAMNEDIAKMNKEIAIVCQETRVTFVNSFPRLLNDQNQLDNQFSTDGVHISSQGYLQLSKFIEPYVYE